MIMHSLIQNTNYSDIIAYCDNDKNVLHSQIQNTNYSDIIAYCDSGKNVLHSQIQNTNYSDIIAYCDNEDKNVLLTRTRASSELHSIAVECK